MTFEHWVDVRQGRGVGGGGDNRSGQRSGSSGGGGGRSGGGSIIVLMECRSPSCSVGQITEDVVDSLPLLGLQIQELRKFVVHDHALWKRRQGGIREVAPQSVSIGDVVQE